MGRLDGKAGWEGKTLKAKLDGKAGWEGWMGRLDGKAGLEGKTLKAKLARPRLSPQAQAQPPGFTSGGRWWGE
jgi:hypothetical protein